MPLLLLWHPQVVGGVNPPAPVEPVFVRELAQGGGAVYPQRRAMLKKRKKREEDELVQLLAIVLPLINGSH